MTPWVWLFGFYFVGALSLIGLLTGAPPTANDAILAILCMVGRELALIREGKR